jgi:riboflavin synthase
VFTGIIAEVGEVISLRPESLVVSANEILKGVELGASIAVNGTCLTVTGMTSNAFTVGLSAETIIRTNLGMLKRGDAVNLERPLGLGGELGGHLVQGHIDGTGQIVRMTPATGATIFRFAAPPEIMRYIVEKGFIAVDGISLTVTGKGNAYFEVSVIEYTKKHTILSSRKIGDLVNLEVDIIAKYAEQFMQPWRSGISEEYLKEQGF